MKPTVTVITSTIGRPELKQCIESVRAQTYKARHVVYVNGPSFHEPAREILDRYTDVHGIYVPEDTGDYGRGGSMADVFAAAPFLTRSDWVFFLDDDNFYEPNHIESLMSLAVKHDLKWAYSLRRIVDKDGAYVCDDDWCSLGHWPSMGNPIHLVDNSCYAVERRLAQRMSLAWTVRPFIADRCFFMALKESGARSGCTGLSTVNYRTGTGTATDDREAYLRMANQMRATMPWGGFPWRKPNVFDPKSTHPAQST